MRHLLVRCAVVAISLLMALMLAEVGLRLLGLAPPGGVATVTEAQFKSIPGILLPDQDLVDRRDRRLPHHVTTNALGYRGPGFPLLKRPGEFRILFTGDAFAYGDFVNDDQTLPAQLEQRLNGRCGTVRVVNAGLDNATLVDAAKMIERGLRVAPDLVVLLFSANDIRDLSRPSTWNRLAENRRDKSRFPLSVFYPLIRHTALWNFALRTRAASQARTNPVIEWTAAGAEGSMARRLRDEYRRVLAALRDTLAGRAIPLVLAAFPSHHAVTRDSLGGQFTWVTQAGIETGVAVVDLLPPLVASKLPVETLYLLPYDGDPSARGYDIAARQLADRLASQGPLAAACEAVSVASQTHARPSGSAR